MWYNNEGKVLLRSEGFDKEVNLQDELAMVLKHRNDESKYEYIDKAGHRIKILKDESGREVGRSCAEKYVVPIAAASVAPAATTIPVAAPIVVPKAAEAEGKFKWWWIILPLLLLALFVWWRGCEKKSEEANVPVIKPIDSVKISSTDTMTAPRVDTAMKEAVPVATEKIKSIFFDFDKSDLTSQATADLDRVVAVLNTNPEYKVKLNAYTDAKGSDVYNAALSRRRAAAAKNYLESKGIKSSRIQTSTFGEKDPIAKNTLADGSDTEEGRRFNRRVEISVLKDGVKTGIVEEIEVPAELKK